MTEALGNMEGDERSDEDLHLDLLYRTLGPNAVVLSQLERAPVIMTGEPSIIERCVAAGAGLTLTAGFMAAAASPFIAAYHRTGSIVETAIIGAASLLAYRVVIEAGCYVAKAVAPTEKAKILPLVLTLALGIAAGAEAYKTVSHMVDVDPALYHPALSAPQQFTPQMK